MFLLSSALLMTGAAAALTGASSIAAPAAVRNINAPPAVSNVELLKYVGRWVEVYSDLASRTFESRFCVTVDYGLL